VRLAPCLGVVSAPLHRQRVFASGCPRCGLLFCDSASTAAQLYRWYSESGEWHQGIVYPKFRQAPVQVNKPLLEAVHAVTGICEPQNGSTGAGFRLRSWALAGIPSRSTVGTRSGFDPALKTAFDRHSELKRCPNAPQFQFVILSHVLEHVTNPGAVITALARATLPGGWIIRLRSQRGSSA